MMKVRDIMQELKKYDFDIDTNIVSVAKANGIVDLSVSTIKIIKEEKDGQIKQKSKLSIQSSRESD